MNIGEFIDTYSDDLIYLHEARVHLCAIKGTLMTR